MPLPALAAASLISAGASVASTAGNAASTAANNKKSRRFAEKMYARQRADALSDWERENAYNSPAAQMERLRAAGLNPNLVYGNGATAEGGSVRSSQAPHWSPEAPQIDLSGIGTELGRYHQIRLQGAQIDNLAAAKAVQEQDALLRASQINLTNAQAAKVGQETEIGKSTLSRSEEIAQTSLDAMKAGLQKTITDTRFTEHQDIRSEKTQAMQVQEQLVRLAKMKLEMGEIKARTKNIGEQTQTEYYRRAQIGQQQMEIDSRIKNLESDNTLKELEIKLKKMGINSSDAVPFRVLVKILDEFGIEL